MTRARATTVPACYAARVDADVCIVGLGTAGAATAYQCARRGLKVIGLERRALADAGARWVNGVPRAAFDRADIPRPSAPELRGGSGRFHLVAGWGPERISLQDDEVVEVDMRRLVARLQSAARQHGADLRGDVRVLGLSGAGLGTARGVVRARYYVDAAGVSGPRLVPGHELPARDLCAAAQQVHAVTDLGAAEAFFAEHRAEPTDALCFTGVAGGYSILNVRLHQAGSADSGAADSAWEVSILTGSVPSLGFPSGKSLLESFVAEQAWVGSKLFGGSRAIPLRAPGAALVHGDVAAIGDSVSQVFAAHGSGIGVQLESSALLAEAIAEGDLAAYSARWHARYGATFGIYDWFRRFTQSLSQAEIKRLLASGLIDEDSVLSSLHQQLPPLWALLAGGKLVKLLSEPWLAPKLASVVLAELRARSADRRTVEPPEPPEL